MKAGDTRTSPVISTRTRAVRQVITGDTRTSAVIITSTRAVRQLKAGDSAPSAVISASTRTARQVKTDDTITCAVISTRAVRQLKRGDCRTRAVITRAVHQVKTGNSRTCAEITTRAVRQVKRGDTRKCAEISTMQIQNIPVRVQGTRKVLMPLRPYYKSQRYIIILIISPCRLDYQECCENCKSSMEVLQSQEAEEEGTRALLRLLVASSAISRALRRREYVA